MAHSENGRINMSPERARDLRDYAWQYFELHAKQRMSVFNFFLILAGLLVASYVASLTQTPPNHSICVILGVMLSVISFLFRKLDQRTAFLIKNAEEALMTAEEALSHCSSEEPTIDQLFRYESSMTRDKTKGFLSTHLTYSRCLRSVFLIFELSGVTATAVSLIQLLR